MTRTKATVQGGRWDGLDASMLKCRTYGHAWDEFYPDTLGAPVYGWRLSLRCTRCTTERHDVIDSIGAVSQRRYIYPDDYHLMRDEMPSRETLRLAMFDRIRSKLAKADALSLELVS